MSTINLHLGNNKLILPRLRADSMDSIVCDPPYELGFMGKSWDSSGIAYDVEMWRMAYRVLKPGGYLLAFGGSRTYHRLACAVEDAGFEIRDQIMWLYASGFPKSHNLEGEHEGKGTALKPCHEPIVVARKPFKGTVLENVNLFGTGALNIDACRIDFVSEQDIKAATWGRGTDIIGGQYVGGFAPTGKTNIEANPEGRWPANLIHDGSDEVLAAFAAFGEKTSGKPSGIRKADNNIYGRYEKQTELTGYGDSGTIARFFFCAKASVEDRNEGLKKFTKTTVSDGRSLAIDNAYQRGKTLRANTHPTVKPTALMQYLCRLVTPPGGMVLDLFMGSGSTGKGAVKEGFGFTGIELIPDHYAIAEARINHAAAKYKPQTNLFNQF